MMDGSATSKSVAFMAGSALICLVCGCSSKPADIRWDEPPAQVVSSDPVLLKGRVVDSKGEAIDDIKVSYALSPREIADITPDGVMVCGKAGKVKVTMSAGELVKSLDVLCALVARIEAPADFSLVVGDMPVEVTAKALDADGKEISGVKVQVASADPGVLEVQVGGLVGKTTGTTMVKLSAGSVNLDVPVQIIEIGSIEVKDAIFLTLGKEGMPLTADVRTIDGQLLKGIKLRGEIADQSIATLEDGLLTARSFGVTTVTVGAGRATRSVQVAVTETLPTTAVSITDGETQSIAFAPGVYRISGEFTASDNSNYGVTARWQGAVCDGSRETQKLSIVCKTDAPATLILSNPSSFGMGPAARGSVTAVRSPIPFPSGS